MPHEKRQFENGELYHVTTRRVGDELFFLDESDYFRGIFSIYEFNNSNPVDIYKRRLERVRFKVIAKKVQAEGRAALLELPEFQIREGQPFPILVEPDKRNKFVEVLAFCLMPNHIHLLLKQLVDKGISLFMQKFGSGFATFFKERYGLKKKGHFYQDRFNAVHIENDNQLRTAFVYVHTNPVALIEPGWKEKGIFDPVRAKKFLEEECRWSSYWDYLGKKNFPSVTKRDFLLEIMGGPEGCRKAVNDWIDYKGEGSERFAAFKNLGLPLD